MFFSRRGTRQLHASVLEKAKLIFCFQELKEVKQRAFRLAGFGCERERRWFLGSKRVGSPGESETLQCFVLILMQVSIHSDVIRSKKANNKTACFSEGKER